MGAIKLILAALVCSSALPVAAATLILPFPGSEQVRETNDVDVKSHRLITGAISRINTQLVPESAEYIRGIKTSKTFLLPDQGRIKVVTDYFRKALLEKSQMVFECAGRDCGASNYWANAVFKQAILYGPEQYQHYFLAWHAQDETYLIVYVAERGTGKLYTLVETIKTDAKNVLDGKEIASAIRLQGKYVFDTEPDDEVMQAIFEAMTLSKEASYMLVSHDHLLKGETITASMTRTGHIAEKLKLEFVNRGIDAQRIEAIGAGPIAPLDRARVRRMELIEVMR